MFQIVREGFAQFSRRMDAKVFVESEDEILDNVESRRIEDVENERKLLYDNLDLIIRHRGEILNTPRYANIDVHYALQGGGAYVGPFAFRKKLAIAGMPVTVNLTLGSLLGIWGNTAYKVNCCCGNTAYIRSFGGSPLSGVAIASAYCPHCKNEIRGIKGRKFRGFVSPVENALASEETLVSQTFSSGVFGKASELCSLEKMLSELKLREYETTQDSEK